MGIINLAIQLLSGDVINNQVVRIKQILSLQLWRVTIKQPYSEKIEL